MLKCYIVVLALVAIPAAASVPTGVISGTVLLTDMTETNGYECSAFDGSSAYQR